MTNPDPGGLVLIVDDDLVNSDILTVRLRRAGYRTLAAPDGKVAIARAQADKPDVILLDIMMPLMDGLETCRQLKANPDTAHIPVVFMTALGSEEDKLRGFEAGGVDYLTKPVQFKEAIARLGTHVALSRLRQDLQAKNEQLEQEAEGRERLIGELNAFAHTVAHDLKSPLSGLATAIDALLDQPPPNLDADQTELLEIAQSQAEKSVRIVDELLLLASVRDEDIYLEPLNLRDIVSAAEERLLVFYDQYAPLIRRPSEWPPAYGQPTWVEEVWYNLISNACKHGGPHPEFELGAELLDDGFTRCFVRDNGPGLTAEECESLFTPFVRLDRMRSQGTGLGLSIVLRIAERLGGRAGAESAPGEGSMFYVDLPPEPSA